MFEVTQRALLLGLTDPDAIIYRQQVLADCLRDPAVVRRLYALADEALKAQRNVWGSILRDSPHTIVATSVAKMELFVGFLRRLREMTDEHGRGSPLQDSGDSSRCWPRNSTRTTSSWSMRT